MTAVLVFVGALVAIAVLAIVVNRLRGVRAQYLDAWSQDPGEERLWEDPRADFHVVPRLGQARVMSFARPHRTHAVLTNTRLVIATRALLSRRYMVTHVVVLGGRGAGTPELERMTGGQFSLGYVVMSARPERMSVETDGAKPYLRIVPDPTPSATNVEHCRLYSDTAEDLLARASG